MSLNRTILAFSFPALGFAACGTDLSNSSTVSSDVPCEVEGASTCERQSSSGTQFKKFTFKGAGFNKAAARSSFLSMDPSGQKLIIGGTNEEVNNKVSYFVAAGRTAQVQAQWSFDVIEYQFRQQKWKKCGTLNLDRCRRWSSQNRSPVNLSLELEARNVQTGEIFFSGRDGIVTNGFSAGPWNTISRGNVSTGGLIFAMPPRWGSFNRDVNTTITNLISGSRELKKGYREFRGSKRAAGLIDLPVSPEGQDYEFRVRARREAGSGVAELNDLVITITPR